MIPGQQLGVVCTFINHDTEQTVETGTLDPRADRVLCDRMRAARWRNPYSPSRRSHHSSTE
jgi:hypothetical protein